MQEFNPWVGKILWRKKWQPTQVFLPEEFHGQRSLAGYSPWGPKELDMTEQLTLPLSYEIIRAILPTFYTVSPHSNILQK